MDILNLDIEDVNVWKNKGTSCINFTWSSSIGFGELTLHSEDGKHWMANTETMCSNEDKEFMKMILQKWLEQIEVVR